MNEATDIETEKKQGDCSRSAIGYPALTWSADRPAAAGWWWAEMVSGDREVLLVVTENLHYGNRLWVAVAEYDHWLVESERFNGWRWAGPLPEPREPSPVESPDNNRL